MKVKVVTGFEFLFFLFQLANLPLLHLFNEKLSHNDSTDFRLILFILALIHG